MYTDCKIKISDFKSGVIPKIHKDITCIYSYGRHYNGDKKYNVPQNTAIRKGDDSDMKLMYLNINFLTCFP